MKKLIVILTAFTTMNAKGQSVADTFSVRLKTFEGYKTENKNKLHWTVACFLNYANFEVQRSFDGANYNTIHSFQSDRLRCKQPFDFEDVASTGKVFYRVRVGDLDGQFYTSKIIFISGKMNGFDIAAMVPTFVTSTATINFVSSSNNKVEFTICNLQGLVVMKKTIPISKGNNEILLDCSELAKGIYVLSTQNSESELKTIRFMKQ